MTGADPRRSALDEALLEWMREGSWARDDARFDALARALFRFQFDHCAPYRQFCVGRGVTPDALGHWREIPAIPTGAFKDAALHSFPGERCCKTFHTSGTSSQRRGALHLDTLALYEASLLPSIGRFVFPELEPHGHDRIAIRVLAQDPASAPDSSLSHMFGCALAAFGSPESDYETLSDPQTTEPFLRLLSRWADEDRAVALCGTAFAFVHLLDAMAERSDGLGHLVLARGSRVMETGGFKGRSREVSRAALYGDLEQRLGVENSHIINQYGMTELGSQFYDTSLHDATLGPADEDPRVRHKVGPPWTRVRIIDPETGLDAPAGEVGMIVIHDLANTGSVAAIQTADLGHTVGDASSGGFQVLGREAGAEERGCSIAADAMMQGTNA